jgi:hypothetical protein
MSDSVNKPPKTCILIHIQTHTHSLFPLGHNFYALSSSVKWMSEGNGRMSTLKKAGGTTGN